MHKFRVLPRRGVVAGGLLVLALCGADGQSSWAQTLAERMPSCLACHGEHGTSTNPEVPSLGGQPAAYMEIQLYLFREKMRPPAVMNEAMQGISNDDLRVLAKLLANLPPPASTEAENPARMQHAQALIHQHRCDFCHNGDLSGRDNVPRIAGQREDYLLKALREYKNNTRPGYDASMGDVVQPLREEDLRELAYFAARQR
jgi:cytochrome c553